MHNLHDGKLCSGYMSIGTNDEDNNSNNNYHLLNSVLSAVTGTLYNDSNKGNCQITTTYYT